MIKIIKKYGSREDYSEKKIIDACSKASSRALDNLQDSDYRNICQNVYYYICSKYDINSEKDVEIPVSTIHSIVEKMLIKLYPNSGEAYRQYRNYKVDFVHMMDKVYEESQRIMYIGDKENSNTDSSLVTTKRSLIYNELNKELYKKFFLTVEEIQAIRDGYVYIHDMSARRDTLNCSLFNVKNVLSGGFEMGNVWYNEPKTLDTAFDVIGDITLSAASCQYGGFTLPQIDEVLAPYAEKSYQRYLKKYQDRGLSYEDSEKYAYEDVEYEMRQGYQGWEYKFNTVASSRGDYPFITITFGLGTGKWEKLASKTFLIVHREGQGKKDNKKPVLFPKLVFLYTEELHGKGKVNEDLFEEGILTSSKAMYPDWLSLDGNTTIAKMYHKYGKVVSPMGCRAFLSPWYEKGGTKPIDENDKPVFIGRFNIGAVSLHLPMILAKSRQDSKEFHEVLDYYLNLIRRLHIRTYEYLGEIRASINPLGFCEGGFYGGNLKPSDKIKPLLKSATSSFGITALNELQQLYNGKSIVEDGQFALDTLKYIDAKVKEFKEEDGNLYAIYSTPAESLCGLQVKQFRKKYGIIAGVSDREYVSNSFHCGVWEDITPIEKQDLEYRFWNYTEGGRIQYCKYPIRYNLEAIRTLVRRAMKMGLYEGVNLSLSYCNNCGHEELSMDVCPKCGSKDLTKIERMNGYLSYTRVHGDTRLNDAKMAEIKDRVSM